MEVLIKDELLQNLKKRIEEANILISEERLIIAVAQAVKETTTLELKVKMDKEVIN